MQAYHPGTGMTLEFPDNTPDNEIQQHFQNAQANMPTQAVSIAQQFIDGARSQYDQIQQAPAPVNGRGFIGLDPQQAQFMLQQRQNSVALQQQSLAEQARNKVQQQQLVQNAMEGEKDRQQQIKLYHAKLKNDMAEAKARAEAEKFKAEQEGITKTIEAEEKTNRAKLEAENKAYTLSPGQSLYFPNRTDGPTMLAGPPKPAAQPPRPSGETRTLINDQGVPTDYRITYDPQNGMEMSRVELGPSVTGRAGTTPPRKPSVSDLKIVNDKVKDEIASQYPPPTPDQIPAITRKVRKSYGLEGFPNSAERQAFKQERVNEHFRRLLAESPQYANSPEAREYLQKKADDMAEVETRRENGEKADIDPTDGKVYYEDPNKR